MKMNDLAVSVGIMWLVLIVLAVGGWIANIVKLFSADALTGMEIARAVGIFMAPLGALLGFI